MTTKRVLSVGQCGVDHAGISRLLREEFHVIVVPADTIVEALTELRRQTYDLVLANRVFDGGGSGLDLISTIKSDEALARVPVMLVSDMPEAQRQAEQLGAVPGFGKAALRRPETAELLAAVLGAGRPA